MSIEMPAADEFGFVKTQNNTGYMTTYLDEFSQEWVNLSRKSDGLNADIGAAYGVATLSALNNSGAKILAIDLDELHLAIIRQEAIVLGAADRLTTMAGDFPSSFESIPDGALENILICRVVHFFNAEKLQATVDFCFRKMKLGGRLIIVAETPYLRNFRSFIPIYEERRLKGDLFPGFIEDVKKVAPERAQFLPPQMHLLDEDVLTRVCQKAGFTIERTALIPRPNFPRDIQLDGRESVGVIACKSK